MGDLASKIKNITSIKNTVTVIGVVAALFIVYFAYTIRISLVTRTKEVPYARDSIAPGIQITGDMVGTKSVPISMLKGEVLQDRNEVINRYSSSSTVIPAGSLFYKSTVVNKEQISNNVILDYPKGYVLYNMAVTTASTYGNSMYPGNYIDIYLKASTRVYGNVETTSEDDKVLLGKLLANVQILAVKDSAGSEVFEDLDNQKTPAMLVFAVPEEYYILLKKSEYLNRYESTLIPVPTNESLQEKPGELKLASTELKDWINRVTIWTQTQ